VMGLTKRIIPCLDVKEGAVVKGIRFKGLSNVGDPPTLAVRYQEQGADEIVFLDVNASVSGAETLHDAVRKTAEQLFVPLTVGGGVRSFEDVRTMLRVGADKVSMNTAAVSDPSLISECADAFGSQCVVVAIDAKRVDDHWEVFTHSGTVPSGRDAVDWAREVCDGVKTGYDLPLTRTIARAVSVPVIASGGCGSIDHIAKALSEGEADAALAASIFHYGEHTVADVKAELARRGIPVRWRT
jgi:cyclase